MKVAVIGAQWGDEGKGKIVDFLAEQAELVVRYSGGANAGHTVVHEGNTYKLHLIPSGVIYADKNVVLGSGMVIDPDSLFEELKTLEEQGIQWEGRTFISDRAHLVLPDYKEKDKELDSTRRNPIGTTGRGIGIAYSQKSNRDGIRVADLNDDDFLPLLRPSEKKFLDPYIEKIRRMSINLAEYMQQYDQERILYEGAQGVMLDLDLGTYPFVSSGCSAAAGAAIGGAIGPREIGRILGVFKAYSTRVGNGPFPTEFKRERDGNLEEVVREIGHEYGVTTGRPRRCGYLDLVALKYACETNSIDSLVLTHPDVYDDFDDFSVCVAYEIDGTETTAFPSSCRRLERATPVLKSFKGWKTSISNITAYDALPQEVRDYIKFIEEYTHTPVGIVSVGPERSQTFIRTAIWE